MIKDVTELVLKKEKLENDIKELITQYAEETKLFKTSIDIALIYHTGFKYEKHLVEINVNVESSI